MALYGYARVSSSDQDVTLQEQALRAAGCEMVWVEKVSPPRHRRSRIELQLLLNCLRRGDTLVVTRIDRLALSIKELRDIVYTLSKQGVSLKVTQYPIDTAGKIFLDLLDVFAEFETNQHRERKLSSIAAAKEGGVHRGRKPTIDAAAVHRLYAEEKLKVAEIAQQLGIARSSVYRVLGKGAPAT